VTDKRGKHDRRLNLRVSDRLTAKLENSREALDLPSWTEVIRCSISLIHYLVKKSEAGYEIRITLHKEGERDKEVGLPLMGLPFHASEGGE
jgi:hypothetical protein